ncbi:TlpA family protein disulfide reductase [Cohnella luojiensis]|uniref:TlpA family protein disulfide reductase n=1 Tax=Cohnella luojiensis TaxID=652876 RepID=A0A4Y8LQW1_9BACL|nr:TlpA disulfide reductase family protein [Cohnella luojiensis]TFE19567.1 TlpA family protein disulfide reductase [Cohnella luojiensis]
MRKIQVISTCMILIFAICIIAYVVLEKKTSSSDDKSVISTENEKTLSMNTENIVLKDLITSNKTSINFSEKPTALLFFTSWCPYCNEDAPKIVELQNKYKDNMNVFGINLIYRDDIDEVRSYVKNYKIEYPVLLDETGDIYEKYGGSGFPALYFFNSKGELIDQIIGSSDIEYIESSFINLQEKFNL